MSVDLGPIQRALHALHYTSPLDEGDERYVQRSDGLRQKLLNRLLAPAMPRLLFSGPAGCGKSTELRRVAAEMKGRYLVVLCPCDRDLDLYKLELQGLLRYLIWRTVLTVESETEVQLTKSIVNDVKGALQGNVAHIKEHWFEVGDPRAFFAERPRRVQPRMEERTLVPIYEYDLVDDNEINSSWTRLVRELTRVPLKILYLIDGLEKVPDERFKGLVPQLLRTSALGESQSVVVVPNWSLQGWSALSRDEQAEILDVPVIEEPAFIELVLLKRAPDVFAQDALEEIARLSAGIVRDALQLATNACRAAADAGTAQVTKVDVEQARREMVRTYQAIFSDHPIAVRAFLDEVQRTGHLPGEPALRDRLLAVGAVLRRADGTYCVHPILR